MGAEFEVFNQTTGDRFTCKEGQSVLKGMEQVGIRCVPVGCRGGGCGYCMIKVLSGSYECGKMSKRHVPVESMEKGEVLACRIYPKNNLVIECQPSM
ncbi:2Fe-2S iron-sulfur cluster binding domain-containing protein [Halomonas sp. A11-A]|uniref:2Fe-2S iron-sulfur cluster binding domain-containing protein n=1 Tax=Halomonas sp. A11-A TaxID=2183985 RepID=UPI000D7106E8